MIVTIWRHGKAKDGSNDRLRELTVTGREDVALGCAQFQKACRLRSIVALTSVLHSPWLRTQQTAEIIVSTLRPATSRAEGALRPGSSVSQVDTALSAYDSGGDEQHIALVSHQPLVSSLVDHYLGARGSVPFLPPGGLVTLSLDVAAAGCGKLLFWACPPEYEVCV